MMAIGDDMNVGMDEGVNNVSSVICDDSRINVSSEGEVSIVGN